MIKTIALVLAIIGIILAFVNLILGLRQANKERKIALAKLDIRKARFEKMSNEEKALQGLKLFNKFLMTGKV